jgi:hypothetical protein
MTVMDRDFLHRGAAPLEWGGGASHKSLLSVLTGVLGSPGQPGYIRLVMVGYGVKLVLLAHVATTPPRCCGRVVE